jgi:protease-4
VLFRSARLLGNLLRLPFFPIWWILRRLSRPRADWVHVRLHPRLVELTRPLPWLVARFFPFLAQGRPTPLEHLRRLADHAARDARIRGVLIEMPRLAAGWASASAVRAVLLTLRERGKATAVYLPEGAGNKELFVAAAADTVILGPQASIMALGIGVEQRYVRPLLDKLGVAVEVSRRGDYKTAAETFARDSMSEPQREQIGALVHTIDGALVGALAARRGMDPDKARAFFAQGWVRGKEAVDAGVADAVAYDDELPTVLGKDGVPARFVGAGRYFGWHEARVLARILPRPYLAVVEVHGPILDTAPGGPSPFGNRRMADSASVVAQLRAARRDRWALGVVLHVDSPGGSALASDVIHREVVRLREKKPVVACMADVAASGGYYVAAPAHAIVAEPVTITGSIGVISMKLVAKDLLSEIGVRTETVRSAPHADMLSPSRALDDDERAIMERETEGFYRAFVTIVADGRGKKFDDVEPLARGRVWSGADAKERGLVDRLGGFATACDEVRARLGLPAPIAGLVEPALVRTMRRDLPPADPIAPAPASAPAAALVTSLASTVSPDLGDLLTLLGGRDRVLYYATGIPRPE